MKTEKLIELINGMFRENTVDYVIMNHEFEDSFDNNLIIIRHNIRSFTLRIDEVFSIKIDLKSYVYFGDNDIINAATLIFAKIGFAKTVADIIWTEDFKLDDHYQYNTLIGCFAASIIYNHIDAAKCIMFTDWEELSRQKQSTLTGLRAEWFDIHNRFNNWLINKKLNGYINMYLRDIPIPVSVECKALMLKWLSEHPEYGKKESEDMSL